MDDLLTEVNNLEKKYNDNKILKATLEGKRESLNQEYAKILEEIKAAGADESDIGQTVTNMYVEQSERVAQIKEQLK